MPGQDRVDEWAWPSSEGYLRDDNSRVKNLVTYHGSVLTVGSSCNPAMVGAGLAGGYTACHVWPDTHPERNTFVANLVWLPTVISRLSDTQGGQRFRLRGHGLPTAKGTRGDLLVEAQIQIPKKLTDREREIWSQLAGLQGST